MSKDERARHIAVLRQVLADPDTCQMASFIQFYLRTLLEEIDELNARIERAVNSIGKPTRAV
jgi:hypothetical protein